MAGYTRQSTFADGDTITAALFNNEFNQLLNAFSNTSGHKHDGTANEGPVIGLIGDAGETSPNNKVLIDTTNNYIEFYVEVSSAPVQQLYIADGAIIPVTDSDIDLGTTSLRFKDTYTDTVTTTGNVSIGGNLTVTGNATISGNLTFGDADTDSINLAAEIDSDIIPNTDGTYDLGSATKEWQDLYIDGTANIDSLVADTADINGGTIDGATIATSDITVGAGKTLDVSAGTLTLADDQISGDKVEGGTIAATTITSLTATSADINGGTIDGVTIGGSSAGAVTFTDLSDGTITITAFVDEDDMTSNSATLVPTQQSVKAYVDSQVTAQDLDITTDSGTIAIDLDSETLTVTGGTGLDSSATGNAVTLAIDSTVATLTGSQTLTNKTIDVDSNTVTNIEVDNLKSGVLDTDLTSVAATDTTLASAKAIKTYVDSQVTAQDLDFQGDTGGALSIDLDSESLTIAGGTGIDTSGATNTLTVAIDSTVATLTGTQTLTNKTLTTPIISSISNTGTLTLPTSTDTLVGRATTDTLTNKTLTSPVINTSVSGTAFLDDDTFATATATTLASSESIKAYVDTTVAATNEVVEDTTPQLGGDLDLNSSDITGTGNINITGTIQSSGNITGTLATAAQPNITSLGTLTGLDVAGTPTFDGLTVDGTGDFNIGTENIGIDITSTDAGSYIRFNDNNATGFYLGTNAANFSILDTGNSPKLKIASNGDISFYEDTGTSQALFWDASAESLGIGTTSPQSKLDVESSSNNVFDIARFGSSTSDNSEITLGYFDATATNGIPSLIGSSDFGGLVQGGENGHLVLGIRDNDATDAVDIISGGGDFMTDSTYDTLVATFKADGKVGIGTDSPDANLHISSAGGTELHLQEETAGQSAQIKFTNPQNSFVAGADANPQIFFINTDGNQGSGLCIDTNHNVGIGTSSPTSELHVKNAADCTLLLQSGDGSTAEILFGDASDTSRGKIKYLSSDEMTFEVNNLSEAMRIDSSGNVGIGATTIDEKLHLEGSVNDGLEIKVQNNNAGDSSYAALQLAGQGNNFRIKNWGDQVAGKSNQTEFVSTAGSSYFVFTNNGSESMRIDSEGILLLGTTTRTIGTAGNVNKFGVAGGSNSVFPMVVFADQDTSVEGGSIILELSYDSDVSYTSANYAFFTDQTATQGSISGTGAGTVSYNTSSDERIKENIVDTSSQLDKIKQIQVRDFNYIGNDTTTTGMIAQELNEIIPNVVVEGQEDFKRHPWGIDYGKLTPYLIKAIQEQQTQIEALQSEINLLKGE